MLLTIFLPLIIYRAYFISTVWIGTDLKIIVDSSKIWSQKLKGDQNSLKKLRVHPKVKFSFRQLQKIIDTLSYKTQK